MLSREYVGKNLVTIAISLFVAVFFFLTASEGAYIYTKDGNLRQFGLGKSQSTIIPAWLASILLAITIYFSVLYYSSGLTLYV